MPLLSHLSYLITEASRVDIMVNKLNFTPEIAKTFVKKYGKKRSLLYANFLNPRKTSIKRVGETWYQFFDLLDYFLSSNNKPKDLFNIIKNAEFREYGSNQFYIEEDDQEVMYSIQDVRERLTSIRDYIEVTGSSIKDKTFAEAYKESEEWHNNLGDSGKKLELKEGQEVVHQFSDGYYWVDLNTNKCDDEADAMGHCANTSADTMLSLRDPDGEPHVTVAYNYGDGEDGAEYTQMKGKGNKKPVEKYWKYCIWLFTDDAEQWRITSYRSEYEGSSDFHVEDYREKDPQLVDKILQESPNLDTIINRVRRYLNNEKEDGRSHSEFFEDCYIDILFGGSTSSYEYYCKLWGTVINHDMNTLDVVKIDYDFLKNVDNLKYYINIIEEGYINIDVGDVESYAKDIILYIDMNDKQVEKTVVEVLEELLEEYEKNGENEYEVMVKGIKSVGEFNDWDDFVHRASPREWTDYIEYLYDNDVEPIIDKIQQIYVHSMEATAYDEIYTDVLNFVKDVRIKGENTLIEDVEAFITYTDDQGDRKIFGGDDVFLSMLEDEKYNVMASLNISELLDAISKYEFGEDDLGRDLDNIVLEFEDSFSPPRYGYPSGGVNEKIVNERIINYFAE